MPYLNLISFSKHLIEVSKTQKLTIIIIIKSRTVTVLPTSFTCLNPQYLPFKGKTELPLPRQQAETGQRQQQWFEACEIPALLTQPQPLLRGEAQGKFSSDMDGGAQSCSRPRLEGVFLPQSPAVRSGLPRPWPPATAQPDESIKRREKGEEQQRP